jgi:hypothetical protein
MPNRRELVARRRTNPYSSRHPSAFREDALTLAAKLLQENGPLLALPAAIALTESIFGSVRARKRPTFTTFLDGHGRPYAMTSEVAWLSVPRGSSQSRRRKIFIATREGYRMQ